jgi:hypothetical protein
VAAGWELDAGSWQRVQREKDRESRCSEKLASDLQGISPIRRTIELEELKIKKLEASSGQLAARSERLGARG